MNEEALKEILSDIFDIDEEEVTPGISNETVGNWDSLNHLRLVSALEREFGVSLTMEEINSMTSYEKMVEFVGAHLEG